MNEIMEIAKKYRDLFEEKKDKEGEYYYCFKLDAIREGSEEYREMSDIISSLQMDEDSVYRYVVYALDYLIDGDFEDMDEARDMMTEEIDGLVDVYTSDLTEWLNKSNYNVYYLTEAQEESGVSDGFQALAMAQYKAIENAFNEVLNLIEEKID